jgi:hypothetical protein
MVADNRSTQTLKERRLATLRRAGVTDRHRVALEKPSAAFYWILIIVCNQLAFRWFSVGNVPTSIGLGGVRSCCDVGCVRLSVRNLA